MRTFLVTLAVSIIASIGLWSFGIARLFWPAHPLLATTLGATICGIVAQTLMSQHTEGGSARK